MTWYAWLVILVALGRVVELEYSRRNRGRLDERGTRRVHDPSYTAMVLLHIGYLLAAPFEVSLLNRPFLPWLGFPALAVFLAANVFRLWVIRTLAGHWNTSIVASQSIGVVDTGPYRWVRHPNYVAVFLEVAALPLVHTAWITALVATALNVPLLALRIATEEKVLMSNPDYRRVMGGKPRFIPSFKSDRFPDVTEP